MTTNEITDYRQDPDMAEKRVRLEQMRREVKELETASQEANRREAELTSLVEQAEVDAFTGEGNARQVERASGELQKARHSAKELRERFDSQQQLLARLDAALKNKLGTMAIDTQERIEALIAEKLAVFDAKLAAAAEAYAEIEELHEATRKIFPQHKVLPDGRHVYDVHGLFGFGVLWSAEFGTRHGQGVFCKYQHWRENVAKYHPSAFPANDPIRHRMQQEAARRREFTEGRRRLQATQVGSSVDPVSAS